MGAGSVKDGMMSPCVDSLASSDCGRARGGLAAAELKKKDDETDGRDETESDEGLSGGEGSTLDRGDEGGETLGGGMFWGDSVCMQRMVDALVAMLSSIIVQK